MESVLETLKDILTDISEHCHSLAERREFGVGYNLLSNIKSTMSDRASTEKHFNKLLEECRMTVLPDIIDNYHQLSNEEQKLCGQMNNFFCGLHLLLGMADVCEPALRKFETAFLNERLIGSAMQPELKRYHRAESGTLRLLRTASKAFARGEDEKSGVFIHWKTYLDNKKEKNLILRFKHNRFNMIFLEGQAIYYHKDDICHFLEHVHGTSNDLLKAVLLDCKEDLYMAGTKSLSYISKFITAPLWRLIESPGHILDMNENFNTLVTFLENAAAKPEVTLAFMTGNTTPFDTAVQPDDLIFSKLLEKSDQIDEIVLPILQNLFTAIKQLLTCMIPEHLPGGKCWDASDNFRQQTRSVAKHNKMPEFIFGQLDHLISFRPNASVLTNEAFLLYSYNKTSQWLSSIPTDEKDKLMQDSIKEGREIRYKFKERIQIINEKRLKAQQEKQNELERIERERLKKAEEMTNDICFYGL